MRRRVNKLKYHGWTYALLGQHAVQLRRAMNEIERWENRTGLRLPGALKEWYSLEASEQQARLFENRIELASLKSILKGTDKPLRIMGRKVLRIGRTNALDETYYAMLDRSADPPVVSMLDVDELNLDEGRFSAFVFRAVWGRLTRADLTSNKPVADLSSSTDTCGPVEFDCLQEYFVPGPHEVWEHQRKSNPFKPWQVVDVYTRLDKNQAKESATLPHRHDYYFIGKEVRILVRCTGDPTTGERPASWFISADSLERLELVMNSSLWLCGTISSTLQARDANGKALLQRLRRRHGVKR
jgi:hypothetical protein